MIPYRTDSFELCMELEQSGLHAQFEGTITVFHR